MIFYEDVVSHTRWPSLIRKIISSLSDYTENWLLVRIIVDLTLTRDDSPHNHLFAVRISLIVARIVSHWVWLSSSRIIDKLMLGWLWRVDLIFKILSLRTERITLIASITRLLLIKTNCVVRSCLGLSFQMFLSSRVIRVCVVIGFLLLFLNFFLTFVSFSPW